MSFNPTLVRLRRAQAKQNKMRSFSFNPTLVRLRLYFGSKVEQTILGFNPTLVRLRLIKARGFKDSSGLFQPHAGSIEADCECRDP